MLIRGLFHHSFVPSPVEWNSTHLALKNVTI